MACPPAALTLNGRKRRLVPAAIGRRRIPSEQRIVVNQSLAAVLRDVDGLTLGEPVPGHADPSFRYVTQLLGRQAETCYTLYVVPGGTQITALSSLPRTRRLTPMGGLALWAARRQAHRRLCRIKACLE